MLHLRNQGASIRVRPGCYVWFYGLFENLNILIVVVWALKKL